MNICIRNLKTCKEQWFSVLRETIALEQELESFISGNDFQIIEQSESSYSFPEVITIPQLLTTATAIKNIYEENVSVELLQQVSNHFGYSLLESLEYHRENFLEENNDISDFTCKYMTSRYESQLKPLLSLIYENIDWEQIYQTISVNDIISFKVKHNTYYYSR